MDPAPSDRDLLEDFVDRQRAEIVALLDDVTEEEARERLVPSLTTVLGLVTHATFVEKVWFHSRIPDIPRADLGLPEAVEPTFVPAPEATVATVRAAYVAACEHSRAVTDEHDLEETFDWNGRPVTLRYVLTHMVAELARHAGHGDILLEQLRARRATDG